MFIVSLLDDGGDIVDQIVSDHMMGSDPWGMHTIAFSDSWNASSSLEGDHVATVTVIRFYWEELGPDPRHSWDAGTDSFQCTAACATYPVKDRGVSDVVLFFALYLVPVAYIVVKRRRI